MEIQLQCLSLHIAPLFRFYPSKTLGLIAAPGITDYDAVVNLLLCFTVIALVLLLWVMVKSLTSLKQSSKNNPADGKEWVDHKLYDLDAQQLKTLINKINKAANHDQKIENK